MSHEVPYRRLPADHDEVRYLHGPESERRPNVPAGATIELAIDDSGRFPGTRRRAWIHLPADGARDAPARLAVFQDGWLYLDPDGEVRAGIVLDNLIAGGAIPSTVGVFVDPGTRPDGTSNRNAEYDAFDSRYADFLLEEIIPRVAEHATLGDDPDDRLVCGGSSGGNCALTAAAMRPDGFGRVISYLASVTQIPGGNPFGELIASAAWRPLRVFMQIAHRDLGFDRPQRNWLAENLRVAAALAEADGELRIVLGDGGHSPNHGGVLLPDALRWHWGDAVG